MKAKTGWKLIPLSLKILFVLFILWVFGSIMNLELRSLHGLPFFGIFAYGLSAITVVLILDIISPIAFLYGLWNRKKWAVPLALTYNSIFVLNSIVTLIKMRYMFGYAAILMPMIMSIIFMVLIYRKRSYFVN